MTWAKSFNISNYMAGKTRAQLANHNRRVAQRLLMLKSKRSNPKIQTQVNDNRILLTKKRK